jgi:carbon-monoxide dehydrogenase large subunit
VTAGGRYDALLRGDARFVADLDLADRLHLVFVRSPVAHARIAAVEKAAAAGAPGVRGVFTATELPTLPVWEIQLIPEVLAQPALAVDVVRYAGERVVAVVADSLGAALDAAELVVVDYEPLPAVTDPRAAGEPGAPLLVSGHGSNVALSWGADGSGVRGPEPGEPFAGSGTVGSGVVVRTELRIGRLAVAPMEGHAVLAVPDGDRLVVHLSTQVPHAARVQIARSLGLPPERVRVVAPHVGGGFGGKAHGGVGEHVVTAAAALRLGRPVQFIEDRAANLATMHGRGVLLRGELRATREGRLVGLRVEETCDAGAYPATGAVEPGKTGLMLGGPYRVPAVDFSARSVLTNLAPAGAYRGPGRAEATAFLERSMDALAARVGLDPVEVRRRNLIGPDEYPYETATGLHYDAGDLPLLLDTLLEKGDHDGWRARQVERRAASTDGPLLGIGLAVVVDSSAWFARRQSATVAIDDTGVVEVRSATASAGQQHEILLRTVVDGVLGVGAGSIAVVEGDTDVTPPSDGSMGSRSTQLAGTASRLAAQEVLVLARRVAAELLEAAEEDLEHRGDSFHVRGVPSRGVTFAELARHARVEGEELTAMCVFDQPDAAYPSAAHLSVVEVDAATGRVTPLRHVAVTDCGCVVDPPGAEGQVVGAAVQGIAQALYERVVHADDGTPLGTSLAEYLVPSAAEVPAIEAHFVVTPSPRNPLGAKGVGEIGMLAAPAAVHGAVLDALVPFGVRHLDLPCTPESVWRALQDLRGSA